MTDTVFLERMQFYGYHGHNPEERTLGQRFEVDVSLETSTIADAFRDPQSPSPVIARSEARRAPSVPVAGDDGPSVLAAARGYAR